MLHLRDAVLPVGFVLDGDVTVELLADEFLEAAVHVDHALAGDDDGGLVAELGLVLEVHADDAAFEHLDRPDGAQARSGPVADVGAGADAGVAAFDDAEDVEGIPDLVLCVDLAVLGDAGAVLMEGDLDVELRWIRCRRRKGPSSWRTT
jgi:hypothetical protein